MARAAGAVRWADPGLLILGSLAGGPLHGYAIVSDVAQTAGVTLGPGTLYAALARLEDRGLVRALPGEDRRRPYEITAAGAQVLGAQLTSMSRFTHQDRPRAAAGPDGGRRAVTATVRPPLLARAVLASYPPSFRERYGPELEALVEDTGSGPRVLADLLAGSARAWVRPVIAGEAAHRLQRRRLATVSTVWVCWCAVFVATPVLLRVLEDPPPAGFVPSRGGWGALHEVMATALAVGWLLVLSVGVPLGLQALRHGAAVRRVVLPPVALLASCAAMFLPLQAYASAHWIAAGRSAGESDIPAWWAVLAVAFLLALGADAVWGTVAMAVGLRRAGFDATRLRAPTAVAGVLVLPMAVVVVLLGAVALVGSHPSAAGPLAPLVYVVLAGLAAVLVVATVSGARGLRALRAA